MKCNRRSWSALAWPSRPTSRSTARSLPKGSTDGAWRRLTIHSRNAAAVPPVALFHSKRERQSTAVLGAPCQSPQWEATPGSAQGREDRREGDQDAGRRTDDARGRPRRPGWIDATPRSRPTPIVITWDGPEAPESVSTRTASGGRGSTAPIHTRALNQLAQSLLGLPPIHPNSSTVGAEHRSE